MKTKMNFYAVCTFLGLSCVFAQAENQNRIYLDSGNVQITKDGIYLDLGEGFLAISSAGQDQNGSYVVPTDGVSMTTCRKCGKEYDEDNQSRKCPHGWIVHH